MNWAAIVLWLISLGPEAPKIVALAKGILDAVGVPARWAAIKKLGDALLPFIDSFPLETRALDVESMAAKEAELSALGVDPTALKDLLPVFEFLLPLLLAWWKNRK